VEINAYMGHNKHTVVHGFLDTHQSNGMMCFSTNLTRQANVEGFEAVFDGTYSNDMEILE